MKSIYKFVYIISPARYKEFVSSNLRYANFTIRPEKYIGFSLLYGLSLGLALSFLSFILNVWNPYLVFLISFLAFEGIMVYLPLMIADKRSKIVEEVLPDALQLMAANCRSGLPPDKALLLSARPEFGPLESEIRRIGKEAVSGKPIEDALKDMSKNFKSKTLERTIGLIIEGMRKGGELADLLEQTAEDIRNAGVIKREITAYVMMYALFIFFAAGFAAPLLFGTSTYLVETMVRLSKLLPEEKVTIPELRTFGMLKLGKVQLSSDFLTTYSIISLTITSFFGSLLIGLIQQGTEKAGIKYIPILLLLDLGLFFLSKTLISTFLPVLI